MDGDLARVIVAGVMGLTITVSITVMAIAKIIDGRRRKGLPADSTARIEERLERMEQAIDAMAMEVERVSEGQRFTTKLLADHQVERQP